MSIDRRNGDKVEFNREFSASLCCVGSACNPETWRRHIALSPDLWDSIFNMDSRLRGRKAERSWNDLQRSSVFQTPRFLTTGKGSDDRLYLREVWYIILLRAIWPIRQFAKGSSKLSKWERILPSTYPLRIFSILQCLTDCLAIYGVIVVAVVVNNK